MTIAELRADGRLLFETIVGSRCYGIETIQSDYDLMGVYALREKDICAGPKHIIEKDATYYELDRYAELLQQRDLLATQLLFVSPQGNWKHKNWAFRPLELIAERLICKETLEQWLNLASTFYSKAIRVGALTVNKISPLDFLVYYSKPSVGDHPIQETLTKVIERNSFDKYVMTYTGGAININNLGLLRVDDDLFYLYKDYGHITGQEPRVMGLLDENGEVIEDGVQKKDSLWSLTALGFVRYKKKQYNKYKNLKKLISNSKVINGYATKSMLHAFRVVEMINNYLDTNIFSVQVKRRSFYDKIRDGMFSLAELKQWFFQEFETTLFNLRNKTLNPVLDPSVIRSAVMEIRQNLAQDKK